MLELSAIRARAPPAERQLTSAGCIIYERQTPGSANCCPVAGIIVSNPDTTFRIRPEFVATVPDLSLNVPGYNGEEITRVASSVGAFTV